MESHRGPTFTRSFPLSPSSSSSSAAGMEWAWHIKHSRTKSSASERLRAHDRQTAPVTLITCQLRPLTVAWQPCPSAAPPPFPVPPGTTRGHQSAVSSADSRTDLAGPRPRTQHGAPVARRVGINRNTFKQLVATIYPLCLQVHETAHFKVMKFKLSTSRITCAREFEQDELTLM